MIIHTGDHIEFVRSRNKPPIVDPVTLEYLGPTKEERSWTAVQADGPNGDMFAIGRWLKGVNITEWWWFDRAPDRMVHRNTLYFKNERDVTMFSLWWTSCKTR